MVTGVEGFRLSPQQRHRWSRRASAEEATAQAVIELRTAVAVARAEAAVPALVAGHEALRTALVITPGLREPLQRPREDGTLAVRRIDLARDDGTFDDLCAGERAPFDLAAEPPCRFALVRLDGRSSRLVVTLDSLVADRRSLGNLVASIGAAIDGRSGVDEPVQYLEYAAWLEETRQADDGAGRYFWNAATAKAEPMALPNASGSARETGRSRLGLRLPPALVGAVEALAADLGPSLEAPLLAAWATLLSRLAGRPRVDLLYGADGRVFDELADAVGLFADALPITVRIEADMPFDQVVRRVAVAAERAREHQPFHDPELDPWLRDPLERDAIGFEAVDLAIPPAAGDDWRLLSLEGAADRTRLALRAWRTPDGSEAVLDCDPRRFDRRSLGRLGAQLRTLLAHAAREPGTRAGDLALVGPVERHWLIHGVNDVPAPAVAATVVDAFERRAAGDPAAPVLLADGDELGCGELAARVHRLARHLRARGVGPEKRVALWLPRSPETVVAMLAVLEAGGAYVPLDLDLPPRRLDHLLRASGATVILAAGGDGDGHRPPADGAAVIDLVAEREAIAERDDAPLPETPDERTLAYVLFTSGTTGRPKAVAVEHRQLMAYWRGLARLLPTEGLTWAHASTFAADLGYTGLLGALLGGGRLTLIPDRALADPRPFAEHLARHRVDALKIVPSHLEALAAGGGIEPLLPRRLLVLGGEAPGAALLERLAAAAPACRVLNHYGPTETTVGVLAGELDPRIDHDAVDLGRPLAGARVVLLDDHGELTPVGRTGELYLGGDSVARGYLDQPGATAERFVPDPFGPEPGARLYRSGDRATMTAAGRPRFAGRIDDQLKIRGFRVEPAEVAATLTTHPEVRTAVAVPRRDGDRRRLVAYAVAEPDAAPDAGALRAHLADRLPAAMVPAAIVLLDALPIGANGKLDRDALPAPAAEPSRSRRAPRGLGETLLADLFAEVLGRPVGTADDFFELGGHSLLATQLITRVRQAFECELELRDFFDHPTVAGLARVVDRRRRGDGALPPIEAVPRDRDLPLSFAQERLWIMHQLQPRSAAYNIPRVVRLEGALDVTRLLRSVTAVTRRHESLRTVFPNVGGVGVQRVTADRGPETRIVDLSALPPAAREETATALAAREIRRPFDLARGPVMRALLLRQEEETHWAVLTMHHIVSDAWSTSVFVEEMVAAYRAGGSLRDRPPLAIQYADYAFWQRERLGDVLERELTFWRRYLAAAPERILPTDRPRPARPTYRGAHLSLPVEPALRADLETLGRSAGVTLFMTLLAGFKALLARKTGHTDVVVGTDVAGRDLLETERLIGFFVNNLVLRTAVDRDPTFRELLARVRASTLAAYGHQQLPFDRLVKTLNPDRELGRTPLFQVLFVMQNTPRSELELDDLRITPVEIGLGSAKFDLGLFVTPRDDVLTLTWSYRTELFEASTVRLLARQQLALLAGACADPDRPISTLALTRDDGASVDKRARLRRRVRRRAAAGVGGGGDHG